MWGKGQPHPTKEVNMKKLLLIGALAIAAAATLAACGGSGGGNTTAMSSTGGGTVSAKSVGGAGTVLVDSQGQALYASDQEAMTGKVLCTGACNSFWQPVTASGKVTSSGSVPGKLGEVKRPDGTTQVTFNGKPLYSFTQDQTGQVTGDGFQDAFGGQQFTWHVVTVGNSGSTSAGTGSASGGSSGSGGGSGYSY
jgi:predicted lipoprotein with Yx(FWY)xxD motif